MHTHTHKYHHGQTHTDKQPDRETDVPKTISSAWHGGACKRALKALILTDYQQANANSSPEAIFTWIPCKVLSTIISVRVIIIISHPLVTIRVTVYSWRQNNHAGHSSPWVHINIYHNFVIHYESRSTCADFTVCFRRTNMSLITFYQWRLETCWTFHRKRHFILNVCDVSLSQLDISGRDSWRQCSWPVASVVVTSAVVLLFRFALDYFLFRLWIPTIQIKQLYSVTGNSSVETHTQRSIHTTIMYNALKHLWNVESWGKNPFQFTPNWTVSTA